MWREKKEGGGGEGGKIDIFMVIKYTSDVPEGVVATTIEATSGGALKRGGTNQLCFTMHIYISKAQHNLTGRHNEAPKNEDHILYLCWPAVGCPQRTNKSISFPVPSKVKPKAPRTSYMHPYSSSKGIGTAGRSNDMCKSDQQSI